MTAAVLAVFAEACSSSGNGGKPITANTTTGGAAATAPNPSTSSTTAVPEPTTTSLDATKAAVLAAYRGMMADSGAAVGHYPVNVSDPRLEDHMAGDELKQVQGFLTKLNFAGEYVQGPPVDTSRAMVKQLVGNIAVVSDCNFDGGVTVNGKTHQVVQPAATQRELINVEVELVGGTWKVTLFSNVSAGCTTAN